MDTNNNLLNNQTPPNLPLAPNRYDVVFQNGFSNVLRLFFNRLSSLIGAIIAPGGGQYIDCPNGLFFNTASQTFALASTGYPIEFNSTYLHNFVDIQTGSSSKIVVSKPGIYNFQYVGQIISTNASSKTIDLWIRRNDIDIGYSNHAYTVTLNNEYKDISWTFNIDLAAGEYLELMVAVSNTAVSLIAQTATPPHPGIASSVITVNYASPLPDPRPTPP